jgi:hypothetical protein
MHEALQGVSVGKETVDGVCAHHREVPTPAAARGPRVGVGATGHGARPAALSASYVM